MTRPRPVLTSAGITGLIQALVLILGFLGYTTQAASLGAKEQTLVSVALAAITLGGNLLHGLHGQAKVTPVSSPAAADGTPLVPAALLAQTSATLVQDAAVPADVATDSVSPGSIDMSAPSEMALPVEQVATAA